MQTIICVLKVALAIRRRTCVKEDDESCDRSSIRSTVIANIKFKDLINDRQTIYSTYFIVQVGNIKDHNSQDIYR